MGGMQKMSTGAGSELKDLRETHRSREEGLNEDQETREADRRDSQQLGNEWAPLENGRCRRTH
jgi:hypothetical protein